MGKIEFSNAKLYKIEPNGSCTIIGPIEDLNCTYSDSNDIPPSVSFTDLSDSFECTCELTKEAIMVIFGFRDAIVKCCPNKRVVHLALHAKKARTRKKNFHRAIKILEVLK